MPTPTGKAIDLYPYQWQALTSQRRFITLLGGTGGGKTWFIPLWLADRIASTATGDDTTHGDAYLALGPTSAMVRDTLVPAFRAHYEGTALEGEYKAQADTYTLPNGAIIYLRSADKPLRIESLHFKALAVDEPSQMKAMIWPVLQARSGFYQAQILFSGYPTNMGWYYHDIYLPWKNGDPDHEVIQFRSTDNPAYPREEYERAKRTLPDWLFEMRYEGKFRKPSGLVYPQFGEALYVEPFEIPGDWPTYGVLDPGVFFGGLFAAWNEGTYYLYSDYYSETVQPARVHAEQLKARQRGQWQGWLYDPARLTDVTDLAEHGIAPLAPANNPVLPGVATVTEFIRSGRLKVLRGRCQNLVDQMEKYSFPTDSLTGDIAKENPIKKDDHLPDCLRYLLHTLEGAAAPEKQTARVVYADDQPISPY